LSVLSWKISINKGSKNIAEDALPCWMRLHGWVRIVPARYGAVSN